MEISEIKEFKIGMTRLIDLVEVLFREKNLLLTRSGYAMRVDDWKKPEETDYDRQIREDIEAFNRKQPKEYRNEPSVKPPYLDFYKYLEGHNQTPQGNFPIRVEGIVGIRRLGTVAPSRQSEYTPSNVVEVRCKNPNLPMGSEIRAGYLEDIDGILGAWEKDTKPPHIDLYTHLKDGTMQSPLHMESMHITRLNRLFIAESIGFG